MKESDLKEGQLYLANKNDAKTQGWCKSYILKDEVYKLLRFAVHTVLIIDKEEQYLPISMDKKDFLNHFTLYSIPINDTNKDTTINDIMISKRNILKKVEQDLEKALEDFQNEIEKDVNKIIYKESKIKKINKREMIITTFFFLIAFLISTYAVSHILFVTTVLSLPWIIAYCILYIKELGE